MSRELQELKENLDRLKKQYEFAKSIPNIDEKHLSKMLDWIDFVQTRYDVQLAIESDAA